MLERVNHIAIAVPDLPKASAEWRGRLGATLSDPLPQPEHGVTVVFIAFGNTKIELLEPLGDDSPIRRFLDKNPEGGIHHICFEVDDILSARDHLVKEGARVIGEGNPKIGAHGKTVIFIHP
ncbi:MAG: methylmalonyl-CoA epimerase, partial [Proteobacteria bacterium]|nr:methylmalonyl-CoA epimerase [Pseudomonadota bacterium]